jgi:cellulose synthase/poly-beta-1,6-N-acetylglucosamine synthase-like glycosyltransferase
MRARLFWGAAAAIAYTYVLFPALVLARARLRPRPHRTADVTPSVSIVIAARNEVDAIGAKLENVLSLDYPEARRQIVVASDGSDDGTDEVVRGYAARGVSLLPRSREGKAPALNAAVAAATGEILVFTDANSIFAPDALRAIVSPFVDPAVGGVAGDQRYLSTNGVASIAAGELRYWDLDRMLKEAESRAGNVISATGAIYAIRRELFDTVPDGVTDDFVTSTGVIVRGYRLVFAPTAVAYEPVAETGALEFDRKVRVITRGLRSVVVRRALLNPFRHGFYALQLFSHKVLRRMMVFPLMVIAVTSPLLWRRGPLYRAATVIQLALYGAGATGALLADRPIARRRPFVVATFFCFVNLASVKAIWNLARGHRIDRWEPRRANPARTDASQKEGLADAR